MLLAFDVVGFIQFFIISEDWIREVAMNSGKQRKAMGCPKGLLFQGNFLYKIIHQVIQRDLFIPQLEVT